MLKRCESWSREHCNVVIAGMNKEFARKLINGLSEKYDIDFKLPEIIIYKKQVDNPIFRKQKYSQNHINEEELKYLKSFPEWKGTYKQFMKRYPENKTPYSTLYSAFEKIKKEIQIHI